MFFIGSQHRARPETAVGLTENEWEDNEARAERFDDAKEALTTERDLAIRAALVKPGSDVIGLIGNDTDEWIKGIDALVRRAADPLPLIAGQKLNLAEAFIRMVDAAIAAAAAPSDKDVQARITEDSKVFA